MEIPADKKQAYKNAEFTHYIRDCVIETCRCEMFFAVDKQTGLQEVMLKLTDDQEHYACFLTWETALKKKYDPRQAPKKTKAWRCGLNYTNANGSPKIPSFT